MGVVNMKKIMLILSMCIILLLVGCQRIIEGGNVTLVNDGATSSGKVIQILTKNNYKNEKR